jgi:DNA-binding IclR family transcriptional regulator
MESPSGVRRRLARRPAPSSSERIGVVRPAHCTALGKVILAALRGDQLDRFLARTELTAVTPKSIAEPDVLKKDIDNVRRSGIAFDDGEFNPEVRCVGVPVKDFAGQVIGVMRLRPSPWPPIARSCRARPPLRP